jgi:F-type H+-transporting ATPase subunit alpha
VSTVSLTRSRPPRSPLGRSLCKLPWPLLSEYKLTFSVEQLKSQHASLLEKLGGGVLTKEIETEMKSVIEAHVADFTA